MPQRRAPLGRCLLVWGGATLVAVALAGWLLPHLVTAVGSLPSGRRVEEWLVLGCEAAAVAATTWLWLLVSAVSVEAARGSSPRHTAVPELLRRLVLVACGVGLAGGLLAPAHAATPPPSPLAGLPLPDRPTSHALPHRTDPVPAAERHRGAPPGSSGPVGSARTVLVRAGDSLWSLARADLPEHAPAAAVDRRWREIHTVNRAVIGEDPDLIRPGQRLELPPVPPSA